MTVAARTLRIACAHDLAYTPQYLGVALGFFQDNGLTLEMVSHPDGVGGVVDTVGLGTADLVLGSLLYAVRMHETGTATHVVAQSNQQTRNVLMTRADAAAAFNWDDLKGRAVVVYPGEAPTAWAAFNEALFLHGLTTADMQLIIGYTAADAVEEFVRSVGDYLLVDAEAALDDRLSTATSVSSGTGTLPWSLYCTSAEIVASRSAELADFRSALSRSQAWLRSHEATETAEVVAPVFPRYTTSRIARVVQRYLELDLWPDGANVRMHQVERWEAALRRDGLIRLDKAVADVLTIAS